MTWWHYLLLSNLYLILFYGFYALLLQRETFFQLNRIYLVGSAVMSFLIPVLQFDWVKQWFITQKVQQTIYSAGPAVIYRFKAVQPQQVTMGQVLAAVYVTGILILSVKLAWQLFTLSRVISSRTPVAAAWSFFKKISVDEQLQSHEVITAHEEVHARQWHSADVLLIEVIMILNWFNPVVYWYRRSIKHIHEFIADRDALKAGANKADYALLLLSQTFDAPVHHLLNPFFRSSVLKQRIMMMQKNRSHYGALVKYGFSAPLFALMLALSAATINNSNVVKAIHKEAVQIFLTPAPALAGKPANAGVNKPTQRLQELHVARPEFKINNQQVADDKPLAITAGILPGPDSAENHTAEAVFNTAEKLPQFTGGINGFTEYLSKTLRNPTGGQGRTNVTFVVERNGTLSDVKAIGQADAKLADEAVKAIAASPRWIPGEQNGKKIRVQYTVPVVFSNGSDTNTAKAMQQKQPLRFNRQVIHVQGRATADSSRHLPGNTFTVYSFNDTTVPAALKPTIIVDGKEIEPDALATIDTHKIASISVIKRKNDASLLYKQEHPNGLILITTKK